MFPSERAPSDTRRNFADLSLPRRDEILSMSAFCRTRLTSFGMTHSSKAWEHRVEHHGTQLRNALRVTYRCYMPSIPLYIRIYIYIYVYMYVIYIYICPITTGQLRPIPPVVFPWVELADSWALQEGKDEWSVNVWNTRPFWTFQASFFHERKDFLKSVVLVYYIHSDDISGI